MSSGNKPLPSSTIGILYFVEYSLVYIAKIAYIVANCNDRILSGGLTHAQRSYC